MAFGLDIMQTLQQKKSFLSGSLAFCFFFSATTMANAAPGDAFGLDAASTAHAMAVTASASPVAAAASNPARLIDAKGIETSIGLAVAAPKLEVNRESADLDTYVGFQFGSAAALPLGPYRNRLYFGVGIHLPTDSLYDVQVTPQAQPVIIHAGSDVRRFDLNASLAVRIWERIAIGAGFSIMPDAYANVNIDFANQNSDSAAHIVVDYQFAPSVGVYAEPIQGLHLGFSYRGAARMTIDVPARILVSNSIGLIHVGFKGRAFLEPHQFNFGVRYDFSNLVEWDLARFALDLEFDYQYYKDPMAFAAQVELYDDNGEVLDSNEIEFKAFHHGWRLATALTWMPLDEIQLALGYAFEKSPVPAQRVVFNILDSNRNQLAFGGEFWLPQTWLSWVSPLEIGFATGCKFDIYTTREMEKYEFLPGNPGFPSMRFEGYTFAWHGDLIFRFK